MKIKIFVSIAVGLIAGSLLSITPASAGSMCNNGTYSSNSGRGTCSWNGGVDRSFSSFSDPGSSSFKRNNGFGGSSNFGASRNNGLGSNSSMNNPFGSSRCKTRFC